MPRPPRQRLSLATFWFDGARERVQGWTDGSTWNNWGVPLFDEQQLPAAIRALEAAGFRVTRHRTGRGDTLRLKHEDESHASDYPVEMIAWKPYWRIEGLTWNYAPARGRRVAGMREAGDLALKGWSIGWDDEISAHAAVRDLPKKDGRRRILVMTQDDREPRDPNEPVDLGLYDLVDGESWELVRYESFATPEDAARAVQSDPRTWS